MLSMKSFLPSMLLIATLACCCTLQSQAIAQEQPAAAEPAQQPEQPAASDPAESPGVDVDVEVDADKKPAHRHSHHGEDVVINVGGPARLGANDTADAVIGIFGDAESAGEVHSTVLSIFGNAHATGRVGEGVVSLFGDVYVDSEVGEAVAAIFGDVKLGPNAKIEKDVVSIGGSVVSDPAAVVHGEQREIEFGRSLKHLEWFRPWIEKCLLYGRPLAFEPGLGWAWKIALGFLALYVLIALLFNESVERCVRTLETQPGQSVLASIFTVLLSPVVMVLLLITVVGIALVPFFGLAMLCVGLFGKAVMLAALGRRVTRFTGIGPFSHVAIATLVGGIMVLGLYVIPILGFISYKVLGILGTGVVVYTLILALRARDETMVAAQPAAAPAADSTTAEPPASAVPAASESTMTPPPETPSTPAAGPSAADLLAAPRAGFWIRMFALAIDLLMIAIIVNTLSPAGELTLVGLAGYGALMWKLKGTTVGGIICNLRVVRLDGREIEWETAIVRALSCFLSLAPAGLGFLWIAFDSNRQAWHDKIAGTVVVRRPPEPQYRPSATPTAGSTTG